MIFGSVVFENKRHLPAGGGGRFQVMWAVWLGFPLPSLSSSSLFCSLVLSQLKDELTSRDVFPLAAHVTLWRCVLPRVPLARWQHSSLPRFDRADGRFLVEFQSSAWFGAISAHQYDYIPGGRRRFFMLMPVSDASHNVTDTHQNSRIHI